MRLKFLPCFGISRFWVEEGSIGIYLLVDFRRRFFGGDDGRFVREGAMDGGEEENFIM